MLTGWSVQPFTGCDTETTAAIPTQARLVTASTITVADREKHARDWLADPGVEIPTEATMIHGITTEHARTYGRPAGEVAMEVAENLSASWAAGLPVTIYNAPYDLTVLHCELSWNWDTPHGLFTFGPIGHIIDPLVIDRHCDRYRRGSRRLADTCRHYGITLTDAHSASADTLAAMRLAWKLARVYPVIGRMDLDELQVKQAEWYRESQVSFAGYLREKIAPGAPVEERAGILLRADQVKASADEWPMRIPSGGIVNHG